MTGWIGATLLVVVFLGLCRVLGLLRGAREVAAVSGEAFAVLGDPVMGEEDKERFMQRHAVRLFVLFFRLIVAGAAAVLIPLGLLWLADRAGLLSWEASLAVGFSWSFILVISVASIAGWWVWRRHFRSRPEADRRSEYSATDRMLHRTAFASVPIQVALSSFEDRIYRRRLEGIEPERPVFVAGLPRSGTTLLLELLHQSGEFAAHTYRQMPFVVNPLLWNTFSGPFRRETGPRERAHGDGMLIATGSPEALEEVIWLAFWKDHYGKHTIRPWRDEESVPEFLPFLRRHMTKVVAVSVEAGMDQRRYLSKNNLNIARVGWLLRAFPEARILLPFREPLQHAASLLRQHRNFLSRHQSDTFTREYMAAIGHFDFGLNLRPIDFDGWFGERGAADPNGLNFWLAYWIATYRALLRRAGHERIRLVDFDALCADPAEHLQKVQSFLRLDSPAALVSRAERVRSPRAHEVEEHQVEPAILDEARVLHEELAEAARERFAQT